jgi:GTPase
VSLSGGDRDEGASIGAFDTRPVTGEEELAEHMVFRPTAGSGFQVERLGPSSFVVKGRGIERLLARYEVDNEDAMAYLEGRLRRIGVLKALEAEGFQPGDEIEIAGVTFDLDPT